MLMDEGMKLGGYFQMECIGKDGRTKWTERMKNLVVNEGLQEALDSTLLGGTPDTAWFVGLTDDTPTAAAADTMASHAGWTEFDEYTGDRQAWTGVRTAQAATNSASVAVFPITGAGGGLGGAFLNGAVTGTAGVLFSISALSANRVVANGDTVNITYSVTAAAS